jgi:glycosyltransferase involved in cell wall biosynthesis
VREVVARVAREHTAVGNQVVVLARTRAHAPPPPSNPVGVAVWRVPMAPAPYWGSGRRATQRFVRRFARGAWTLAARIRTAAPEVVAVHCSKFYAPWVMVARRASPAPIVVHLHNAERTADGPPSRFWSRRLLRSARHVIAVSPAVGEFAVRMHPALTGRVSVIRNGVDPGEFDGIEPETRPYPFLLAVGRLAPQKGFDVLLDALGLAAGGTRLVVAGDGPDREALVARATHLGLGACVEFLGDVPRERVKRLLCGATAVVMPSRFEGNPLIALEAMQAGAPLVASDIPGLPEELRDGVTGVLVRPEDPRALANALDRILGNPVETRGFGRAAALAARGMPTWRAVSANMLAVYERVAHST